MSIPYHELFHFLLYSPIFAQSPQSNEARPVFYSSVAQESK
jgi:ornithine decarboxylase